MRSASFTAATLLFLASCGSVTPHVDQPRVPCPDGHAILTVRNNSGGQVDIVETRGGSGSRVVIATVGGGTHEVQIRSQAGYGYFARRQSDGRVVSSYGARNGTVELDRECRGWKTQTQVDVEAEGQPSAFRPSL